jgi:hypothetical protein
LHTTEECNAIKEKLKRFVAARNGREGASGSGLGDSNASPAPGTGEEATDTPGKNADQEAVEN